MKRFHASNELLTSNPYSIVINMDTTELRWFQQVADGITVTEVSDLEQVS